MFLLVFHFLWQRNIAFCYVRTCNDLLLHVTEAKFVLIEFTTVTSILLRGNLTEVQPNSTRLTWLP